MTKFIAYFSIAVLLAGCSTTPLGINTPTSITKDKMSQIDEGVTTRGRLTELLGEPEMKIPTEYGMAYFYKDVNLSSLWVVFDDDWTVREYNWSE